MGTDSVKLEIIVDDKGSLVIKNFKDVVGTAFKEIPGQAQGAGSAITKLWKDMALGDLVASGIKSTYSAFVGILKDSAGEYMRAEEGNAALRQTLVNLGDATEGTFNALDKYAAQIQATTVVDDDMAKSLMQLGLNMGIPIKQIGGATEAAIGLTKAFKGMSLDTAMKATAAAFEGNTQKLQRYIPELKETATVSEKLAIVQKAMADGLKIAHNEITTGAGKIKQWKNDWGDVKESIGKVLVEAVLPLAAGFKNFFGQNKDLIVGFVQSLVTGFQSIVAATEWVVGALGKLMGFIQKLSPLVDAIVNGWRNLLVLFTNELSSTYDKLGQAIVREAAQEMKSIERFREMAAAAGLTGKEIRELSLKYKDVEDAGIKHEKMLRDLIKTHPELAAKLKESAIAGAKVSTAAESMSAAFTLNIPKTKELAQAHETLAEKIEREHSVWYLMQGTMKLMPGALKDNDLAQEKLNESMSENVLTTEQLNAKYKENTDKTTEAAAATEKWYQDAQYLAAGLMALVNVFDDLIPGLGDVIGGLMGAYEGVTKFAAASAAGTATLGGFLGMAGAVIGGFMALCDAYDAYNQGQQRDFIIGMNEGIDVTEEMAEKIRLLAQEMADANSEANNNIPDWAKKLGVKADPSWDEFAAATSKALADIINATDLTADNFDEYAIRVRGILSDLDRGMLTEAETAAAMGDAFSALIGKAKELGTEGSASLIAMFDDLANRGIKVAEVQAYITAQMAAGLEGYKAMEAATLTSKDAMAAFGDMNIKVFEDMIKYEALVGKNQGLIDGINGATAALTGLSNAGKISQQQFDDFGKAGDIAYKKLLAGGMNESRALQAMGPYLQRLQFLHEQYGYALDAKTEKLLKNAIKEGVVVENQKTDSQKMIDLLKTIADTLLNSIPGALMKTAKAATDAFGAAGGAADAYGKKLKDLGNIPIPATGGATGGGKTKFAASGYQGWVPGGSYTRFVTGESEDEYVDITPRSKMGGFSGPRAGSDAAPSGNQSSSADGVAQGRTISNTFHLYNVIDADNVLDIISEGISSNRRSIRSKLEGL